MKQYDYLLVGSGLFAGVFAYYANKEGKKCLVIEKRDHVGGNIACEEVEGINVHKYGAHIFHTTIDYLLDESRTRVVDVSQLSEEDISVVINVVEALKRKNTQ